MIASEWRLLVVQQLLLYLAFARMPVAPQKYKIECLSEEFFLCFWALVVVTFLST